ncbi:MAG TPA: hypothetical protein VIV11_18950 [Kofleriaceae bacterium]
MEGRLGRMVVATAVGAFGALVIAVLLPQTSQRGWGAGALGLANPVLVGAGACGIAMAVYALLGVLARLPRIERTRLPRATMLRSRR